MSLALSTVEQLLVINSVLTEDPLPAMAIRQRIMMGFSKSRSLLSEL
jgi:hypothetical protein